MEPLYGLGHFQVGSYRYRSRTEALYTLNSPPVVSFKAGFPAEGCPETFKSNHEEGSILGFLERQTEAEEV